MFYHLRKALEQKVGFELDSVRAFRRLEVLLYENRVAVSYSTLNRIFNPNYQVHPRNETLDLLSNFLGFKNFQAFELQHQNKIIKDELYFEKELELNSYLLNNDFDSAIDLYLDCQKSNQLLFQNFTQILGQTIFNRKDFDQNLLQKIIKKETQPPYFLEYFVFEDDFHGHYQKALKETDFRSEFSESKEVFKKLYNGRKAFLKGEPFDLPEVNIYELNYHLRSRYFELCLYHLCSIYAEVENFVEETTESILQMQRNSQDFHRTTIYAGRWCRALIYTGMYKIVVENEEWIQLCKNMFYSPQDNIEFKAPLYTFLKLSGQKLLPLDFYTQNRWESSIIEAQLILSIAFNNQKAIKSFKKSLNLKLDI